MVVTLCITPFLRHTQRIEQVSLPPGRFATSRDRNTDFREQLVLTGGVDNWALSANTRATIYGTPIRALQLST